MIGEDLDRLMTNWLNCVVQSSRVLIQSSFFFHKDMLEQIATSEKVFDVSRANKVSTGALRFTVKIHA